MRRATQMNHGYLEGLGRLRLHYRTWEVDRPRAALIVVHGLFEHGRRYEEFAETMASYGFSTFVVDLRGHGASEGRRGHVPRFDVLLQDLDRFRREVQGLVPVDLPLFLVAHSLGGLIGLRYLEEYDVPFTGAVLTSPWLGTAVEVPRWQILAATVLNRVLPAFPFPFRLDASLLTHDPERAADYADDPQIHSTITPRLFVETSSAIEIALRRGDRVDIPVLFLIAGDDRVVDAARSEAFARSLPTEHVTIDVLEDHYHEVLQEIGRSAVMAEIRDWINDQLE
jgi:alpha-beta hydrolase superfamily lysophospholipase